MELVLEAAEHPVGGFSLDLSGRDETTGQRVIVENQLAESDHTHLVQILTYAAVTDPTTIVWITTGFRSEHRAALDWLNERATEETRFFGVEIEVVRIGDSIPAPAFQLVTQPNDWGKQVRAAAQAVGMTERKSLYSEFWLKFSERLKAKHPDWTRGVSTKSSWFGMSTGVPTANWVFTFSTDGLGVKLEFVYLNPEVNIARFETLLSRREGIETLFGAALRWDPMVGFKATKIAARTVVADVADRAQWDQWIDWLIDAGKRLREALQSVGGVPAL